MQKNREMQRGIVSCVAYRENPSRTLDEQGCEQSKLTSYSKESRGRCNSRHIFGHTAVNASVMRTDSCYLKNRTIERRRISILMPTNPWDWKSASYTLHENRVSFIDNQVWRGSYNLRRNLRRRGAQKRKKRLVQCTPFSLFPWLRKPTGKTKK